MRLMSGNKVSLFSSPLLYTPLKTHTHTHIYMCLHYTHIYVHTMPFRLYVAVAGTLSQTRLGINTVKAHFWKYRVEEIAISVPPPEPQPLSWPLRPP